MIEIHFFLNIFFGSLVLTAAALFGLFQVSIPQNIEAEQMPERIATILYQPEKYSVPQKKEVVVPTTPQEVTPPPVKPPVEKAPPPPPPEPKKVIKVEIKPKELPNKPIPKEMVATGNHPKPNPQMPKARPAAGGGKRQSEAKEGEGARAKGKEGARGSTNGPKSNLKQEEAFRPSPEGGAGKGSGSSQVLGEGNVDILKAATGKIENILGNSAAQLGHGGEKLKGYGGFSTKGSGGLGLSGNGQGGGGDADSLGGLGKKGQGGGKIGTGKGAAGNGTGIIGGQARVALKTGGPEETVVMGAIDADAIAAAIAAHKDEFRLCYEKEINAETPALAGRVSTNFVIGSTGRVTKAGIESSTLKNANTESCILNVIRRIDFPIPQGAGVVQVTYPFKFNPVGH